MVKEDVVYIYNGILLLEKKNEILQNRNNMDGLEGTTLIAVKSEKDKYYFICMWDLK